MIKLIPQLNVLLIIGCHQPDEDDYGYVSKDAMDIYNNIVNKYVNTPADSRNAKAVNHRSHDISGTKVCCLFKHVFIRNVFD